VSARVKMPCIHGPRRRPLPLQPVPSRAVVKRPSQRVPLHLVLAVGTALVVIDAVLWRCRPTPADRVREQVETCV
jgi:hypothetical protein